MMAEASSKRAVNARTWRVARWASLVSDPIFVAARLASRRNPVSMHGRIKRFTPTRVSHLASERRNPVVKPMLKKLKIQKVLESSTAPHVEPALFPGFGGVLGFALVYLNLQGFDGTRG